MAFSVIQHCKYSGVALQTTHHFKSASLEYAPVSHWIFSLDEKDFLSLQKGIRTPEERFLFSLYPLVKYGKAKGTNKSDYSDSALSKMAKRASYIVRVTKDMCEVDLKRVLADVPSINLSIGSAKEALEHFHTAICAFELETGEISAPSLRKLALSKDESIKERFKDSFYVSMELESKIDTFNHLWNEYPQAFPMGYEAAKYQLTCEPEHISLENMNHIIKECADILDFTGKDATNSLTFYRFLQKRQELAVLEQNDSYGGLLSTHEYVSKRNKDTGINVSIVDFGELAEKDLDSPSSPKGKEKVQKNSPLLEKLRALREKAKVKNEDE